MLEIILIIVIIILIIHSFSYREHYDDRLHDFDIHKCANECKQIYGCFGFAHDKDKNICYISKSPIDKKPDINVLYRDEYNKNHMRCTKLEPVFYDKNVNKVGYNNLRKNSIYVCKQNEDSVPQWYLHRNNMFVNIGEKKNIDEIFDIDIYNMKNHEYPTIRVNKEQLDLIQPKSITNLNLV